MHNRHGIKIYDRGAFYIDKRGEQISIRYDLRSLHALVYSFALGVIFFTASLQAGWRDGLWFGPFFACCIYGGGLALAAVRVRLLIHKAVLSANFR